MHQAMTVMRRAILYWLIGLTPWLAWGSGILWFRFLARASKDPALYTGTCYKPNGYPVSCTFEQWRLWDITPGLDFFIIIGGLLAAAISGYVFLRFRQEVRSARRSSCT